MPNILRGGIIFPLSNTSYVPHNPFALAFDHNGPDFPDNVSSIHSQSSFPDNHQFADHSNSIADSAEPNVSMKFNNYADTTIENLNNSFFGGKFDRRPTKIDEFNAGAADPGLPRSPFHVTITSDIDKGVRKAIDF